MKYKATILYSFIPGIVLAASMGLGSLRIATVSTGSVIKGSSTALYYLAADGKRYVFPNDKAYFSWYPDFSEVQKISDAVLASYPLGGNVTYRPGTQLVKIQSDPKVYAIDKGGVLRWVNSESAAVAIFGSNWNKKVDDIADAFFINYTVGSPISSAGDYNPATEAAADATINTDRALRTGAAAGTTVTTPPATASGAGTVSISLSPYASTLQGGQSTTVTATGNDTTGISSIAIYATSNGSLVQTCPFSSVPASASCTMNLYGNDFTNGANVSVYAQLTDKSGNVATSSTTTLSVQNNNVSGTGTGTVSISLSPYATTLAVGQSTTASVTAYNNNGIASMGIYVNGTLYQTCPVANYPTANACSTTLYGSSYTSGSTIAVYAQTTDRYGNTAVSTTSTLTTGSTANGSGSVTLSFSPYASSLASNQSTIVTANASDANGIASLGIYVNGALAQSCAVANYPTSYICTMTIYGGSYTNYGTISVYSQLTDRYGSNSTSSTTTLQISNTSGSGNGSVSLSLSPYASTLANNQTTTASANAYDTDGIANVTLYVNGALVQSCPSSNYPTASTCTYNLYGGSYNNGSTVAVYAQLTDRYGNLSTSPTTNLTVQNSTGANNGSLTLSFSPYATTLATNQSTTITANAYDPDGLGSVAIYVNGSLSQSCAVSNFPTSSTCPLTISGGNYASGSTVAVYAQITDRYGAATTTATTNLAVQTAGAGTAANGTVSLSFAPYASYLPMGQSTTVTADASDANGIGSMTIYVNGLLAQTCPSAGYPTSASCSATINASYYTNGQTVSVYATAINHLNSMLTSATSSLTI